MRGLREVAAGNAGGLLGVRVPTAPRRGTPGLPREGPKAGEGIWSLLGVALAGGAGSNQRREWRFDLVNWWLHGRPSRAVPGATSDGNDSVNDVRRVRLG